MREKIGLVILLLILFIGNNSTQLHASQTSLDEVDDILIGFLGPLTGSTSTLGQSWLKAVEYAVDIINGSLNANGHNIRFIIGDTKGTQSGAIEAAQQLVSAGVVGMIGTGIGETTIAAADLLIRAEIPMIEFASDDLRISHLDDNGFIFRNIPSSAAQGEIMARTAIRLGYTNITRILRDDLIVTGLPIFDSTFLSNSGQNISYITLGYIDQSEFIENLFSSQSQAIFLDGNEFNWLLPAIIDSGWDGQVLLGNYILTANAVPTSTFNGMIFSEYFIEPYTSFLDGYRNRYDEDPVPYADHAYEATRIILEFAIGAFGLGGQVLRDRIQSVRISEFFTTGSYGFDANGDRDQYKFTIKSFTDGQPINIGIWQDNRVSIFLDKESQFKNDGHIPTRPLTSRIGTIEASSEKTSISTEPTLDNKVPFSYTVFVFTIFVMVILYKRPRTKN